MSEYKHGISGEIIESSESISISNNTAIYVGVMPIFRVREEDRKSNIFVVSNKDDCERYGFNINDDFKTLTLNQAMYVHFYGKNKIGPIILINALDPSNGVSDSEVVDFSSAKKHVFENKFIDIASIKIADKEEGKDYELKYTSEGKLEITSNFSESVTIEYNILDPSLITPDDIIGSYDISTEKRTGIRLVEDIYEELNVIPSLILAPGFSHIPKVRQALLSLTKKINGMWESIIFVDLESNTTASSIEEAIKWKKDNNYNDTDEKVFWPKAIVGGKEIYLSAIGAFTKMVIDNQYKEPYQTISNKAIEIDGLVTNKPIKFDMVRANNLNMNGITTSIYHGGKRVLWGPHMANYEHGVTKKPEEIFDINIIMNKYLLNQFFVRNLEFIDSTMSRHDRDSKLTEEQMILDSYVSAGKLLYAKIIFESSENSKEDVIEGNFKFKSLVTNVPVCKYINNQIQYTSEGLNGYYEDSEGGEE